MEKLKDYINNGITESKKREPYTGEIFYNIDKPKWSKSIAEDIEDVMRRLQIPIICKKYSLNVSYLSNDFHGTRRYKTGVTQIACDKHGIVLYGDNNRQIYIPLDNIKEKLKYWIEDEIEVVKVIEFIEDFDFN